MRSAVRILQVLGVAALAACSSSGPAKMQVRDSAGVRLVDIGDSTVGRWEVVLPPHELASSSIVPDGPTLGNVLDVLRLADGRFVVVNDGVELLFYAPDGAFVMAVGRRGAGPGEFQLAGWVQEYSGDSLAVWDWSNRRISVLGPSGDLGRIFQPDARAGFTNMVGVLGDGFVAYTTDRVQHPVVAGGSFRETATFIAFGPDGTIRDTIGQYVGEEWQGVVVGGQTQLQRTPLGPMITADVQGTRLLVGETSTFGYDSYGTHLRLSAVVRMSRPLVPVSDLAIQRVLESRRRRAGGPTVTQPNYSFPENLPAFGRIVAGGDGTAWLLDAWLPGDTNFGWWVFDSDGALAGRVSPPPGVRIVDATRTSFVGTWTDDEGFPHIAVFGLRAEPDRP